MKVYFILFHFIYARKQKWAFSSEHSILCVAKKVQLI